ncbi:hypothetical protein GG344DRAFT_84554 [Lentinula edodes]|nr:hypothetical protein GG344DRAFT_84554 [Lentinula edodes]
MYRPGMPSSYGSQTTSGSNLRSSQGNQNTSGVTRTHSRQPPTASSTNYSSNDEDEDDESLEDMMPRVGLPSDFFSRPVGSLQFEWFGEFPNTEEDVSYVQLPLPNGIEWKIRIFPSGRASMTSFGYFLQPVGDDGVPRVPNGFNVRLGSGGPPIDSWEQRFNKCCNITVPPINENEKWFFQEGQKVVVCHHQEVVGEVQIPIHPDRERQRDRRRNNGRPVRPFPLGRAGFSIISRVSGRSSGSRSGGGRAGGDSSNLGPFAGTRYA